MPNITTNHAITYTNTEGQNYGTTYPKNKEIRNLMANFIKRWLRNKYSISYSKNYFLKIR